MKPPTAYSSSLVSQIPDSPCRYSIEIRERWFKKEINQTLGLSFSFLFSYFMTAAVGPSPQRVWPLESPGNWRFEVFKVLLKTLLYLLQGCYTDLLFEAAAAEKLMWGSMLPSGCLHRG